VGTRAIELVSESPGINQVWLWRNIMFVAWQGQAEAELVRKLGPLTRELLPRTRAQKLSYIHLVRNSLALPDAETRDALLDLSREYVHQTACVAAIIEGGGFWASAIRGFITGIRVLAPRELSVRMHKSTTELLAWFPEEHARLTGVEIDPSELIRQVEHVRSTESSLQKHSPLR
jgi:hypothetical protein